LSSEKPQPTPSSREGRSGRFYAEVTPDERTHAQRDRDRILYSAAFARLAEITQVTSPERGHVFHNRLTHSLKVGQIARRIAERLSTDFPNEVEELGGADPDAAEAAGLAHDLGHPPFGHVAEEELDRLVKSENVKDGYEGNAQSFRIVVELASSDARSEDDEAIRGLNLTRQVLDGILKYPWAHQEHLEYAMKWGYYSTEEAVFTWVREAKMANQRSLIAEIMDWADDLAFAVHDLLDFFCAGRIPIDRCKPRGSPELDRIRTGMFSRKPKWEEDRGAYEEALASIVEQFPFDADERYTGCRADREKLFNFSTILIGRYVGSFMESFQARSPAKDTAYLFEIKPEDQREVEVLKQFTWEYVILDPDLAVPQQGQRKAIGTVFERLLKAANDEDWHLFPPRFRELFEEAPSSDRVVRHVADCISAMTEKELMHLYRSLQGF
jgi:dGTPase